jgi:uncharacterized protein (TIGR02996 family)
MSDEAALLAYIRGHPDDATAKLVYADWLDERGDPRAAVIRAAERLSTLSVLKADYWEAKAARTELFATADGEWLAALGYSRRHRPMFTALPADRGSRWLLLDRFVDVWREPLRVCDGYSETELADAEARLEFALPAALREFYAFAGKRFDVFSRQDRFIELAHLRLENDRLMVRIENQGCTRWYVRAQDLHFPDPPVYGGDDNRCVSLAFSKFVLFTAVYEAKFDRGVIWCQVFAPEAGNRDALLAGLVETNLPKWYWFRDPVTFWEGDDLILEHHVADDWWATVRTETAYAQLVERTSGSVERWG